MGMLIGGETVAAHDGPAPAGHWLLTRREPYGVVVRITAYNHPPLFAAEKIGPPLITGNTLVLKVPEQTPLAPLRIGELLRHFDGAPFSGHRQSGTDSDEGIEELYSFTQTKTIAIAPLGGST